MANAKVKLVWTTFSVAGNPVLNAKYSAVVKAQKALSDAKKAFEPDVITALVKAGKAVQNDDFNVAIAYNFGKLSFAQAPKGAKADAAAAVEI